MEHDKNYKETAELFDVSYTQVYQWVKKYQGSGEEGLVDRRGQHKREEQLSKTEALQRKVKLLERQLKEKEMENELLEVRKEAIDKEEPEQYPIAFNARIAKYKESLNNKTQSA